MNAFASAGAFFCSSMSEALAAKYTTRGSGLAPPWSLASCFSRSALVSSLRAEGAPWVLQGGE